MERKCSVCGSPMRRTSTDYRCSFCTNIELLDAKTIKYAGKPDADGNTSRTQSERRQQIIEIAVKSVISLIVAVIGIFIALRQQGDSEQITFMPDIMEEETANSNNQMEAGEGQLQIQSNAMKQALEDMFQKPFEHVTEQEIQTVRYLEVKYADAGDHCYTISYSFEDYRNYGSDGRTPETFPYNEEFSETIKTKTYIDEDSYGSLINCDVQYFSGVGGLCLNEYYWIDLAAFTNLSYVNAGNGQLEQALKAGVSAENITALKLNGEENISCITEFTSLKELCLDCCEPEVLESIVECQTLEELWCIDMPEVNNDDILRSTNLKAVYRYISSDEGKNY